MQKSVARNKSLDIIKIVATVLVVFSHGFAIFDLSGIEIRPGIINAFWDLSSVGVPVFFAISGFLLFFYWDSHGRGYKRMMVKSLRTLAIPFLLWLLLFLMLEIFEGFLTKASLSEILPAGGFLEWINYLVGIPFFSAPLIYQPLWFIRDLFILRLLAPLIYTLVKKCWTVMLAISFLIWFLPFTPTYTRFSLAPFILSACLCRGEIRELMGKVKRYWGIAFLLGAGISIINTNLDIQILTNISYALYCFAIYGLGYFLEKKTSKLDAYIEYSFLIYMLHGKIIVTFQKICIAVILQNIAVVCLEYFLLPLLSIAASLAIAWMLKRFAPKLTRILTGGR